MSNPPDFYLRSKEQYPDLFKSFEDLSTAAKKAGPLDDKSIALVKLALSLGSGLEGASHSGVRKALAAGCTPEEIKHVVLLGITTHGFPAMMRAKAWVEDILEG